jgi:ribosomal protein L13
MASKIAFIIQGKNSPHYRANKVEPNSDRCIIINANNVYLTGNKLKYKMYRHHSGKVLI